VLINFTCSFITHVDSLPMNQDAFRRRFHHADENTLGCHASHHSRETFLRYEDEAQTAAARLFIVRSTLLAAFSFRVQFVAVASSCWSE